MLTLTENAAHVVKTITAQTTESAEAGLRISGQDGNASGFGLNPAEVPQPGDEVVEEHGARVFLDQPAAVALGDEVLDAQVDEAGQVSFALAPRS